MQNKKISIIIPAYNEAKNIGDLLRELQSLHPDFEILVVDDGSHDNTAEVATQNGAVVYRHPYNIGNGAAIKSGIRKASGEILVFMDGDGQHNPRDVKNLLKYLPEFDMVVGSRTKGQHASLGRAIGNWIYNRLASYVANFQVQDLTSGFRAMKSDIARKFLYRLPNTYSYPTTLSLSILRGGWSVKYTPVTIHQRKTGKSNISVVKDGIRFFMMITKICTLYSPMRIFLPFSFGLFCTGLSYYLYTLFTAGRFTNMSALLFTTSILVFMLGLISEQISQMRFDRGEGERLI